MLTTARLTKRKKLKNNAENSKRENNFKGVTENMIPTLLNIKNSRGQIIKEKQLRKPANIRLMPKKHYLHLYCLVLNISQLGK